jgi:hypothetical protein
MENRKHKAFVFEELKREAAMPLWESSGLGRECLCGFYEGSEAMCLEEVKPWKSIQEGSLEGLSL